MIHIARITGIIGAGKTHLIDALQASKEIARLHGHGGVWNMRGPIVKFVREIVEENPTLVPFYRDQRRWAFSIQAVMESQYRLAIIKAIDEIKAEWAAEYGENDCPEGIIFTDWGITRAFSESLWGQDKLDDLEIKYLREFCDAFEREISLRAETTLICLDTPVDVCMRRKDFERKRECERNIMSDYLVRLRAAYYDVIAKTRYIYRDVVQLEWSLCEFEMIDEIFKAEFMQRSRKRIEKKFSERA